MNGRMKNGLIGLVACAMSGSVFGAGFQLYTEGSAEAMGQAAAISGRTNLTSLAWYNPSALVGSRQAAVMAGGTLVQVNTEFEASGAPAQDAEMADDWRPIPHFYYVQPISDKYTALLSINSPYGLITEWPDDWSGSPAAIYSEPATVYATPSIAWKVNEQLSLSAGFNAVYSEVELSSDRGPLGERTVEGNDVSFGYTASGHVKSDDWGVGLRFQSRVRIEPEGAVSFSGTGSSYDAKGYANLPTSVNFGIANTSFENLTLGMDVVWTEWSAYDTLRLEYGSGYPGLLPNPEVVTKQWKDVFSFRFGAEYALNDQWALRGGYVYDESPVNDLYRAPELPGDDRHMVMAGLGWTWNQLTIDAAYSFLWLEKTSTGAAVAAVVPGSAGDYEATIHLVALSAGWHF